MCGIAGYVCNNGVYDKRLDIMFPILGLYMENRGSHSWGWTDGVNIDKHTGAISSSFGPQHSGAPRAALHTRHATIGAHTAANSHPWEFEHEGTKIIGMHNGVVYNHSELNTKHGRNFQVDSMQIFQHIVEDRDIKEVEAYGAIVYFETVNGKERVTLGRFNGGQLAVAKCDFGHVYASTDTALQKAFSMVGITGATYFTIKEGEKYYIQDDTLWMTDGKQLDMSRQVYQTQTWDQSTKTFTRTPHTSGSTVTGGYSSGYSRPDWQDDEWRKRFDTQQETEADTTMTQQGGDDGPEDVEEKCSSCAVGFKYGESYYTTKEGSFCDGCLDEYYGVVETKKGTPGPDDKVQQMTAAEWNIKKGIATGKEATEFPVDCDNCTEVMHDDDDVYIFGEEGVEVLTCEECATQIAEEESKRENTEDAQRESMKKNQELIAKVKSLQEGNNAPKKPRFSKMTVEQYRTEHALNPLQSLVCNDPKCTTIMRKDDEMVVDNEKNNVYCIVKMCAQAAIAAAFNLSTVDVDAYATHPAPTIN